MLKRIAGFFRPNNDVPTRRARLVPVEAARPTSVIVPDGLVALAGTTTTCKSGIHAIARRHSMHEADGRYEATGSIRREPSNPVDPKAVAVWLEGERIGYLPGYLASQISFVDDARVPVQIFSAMLPKGLRCEAWCWLGGGTPKWKCSARIRPPMGSQEKAQARLDAQVARITSDPDAADDLARGVVHGMDAALISVEPIKQLKREGRLEEALKLCYVAIEAAETAGWSPPAPWYTEQAAIIHRKLKEPEKEIAVLERWTQRCPADMLPNHKLQVRLEKLLAKHRGLPGG